MRVNLLMKIISIILLFVLSTFHNAEADKSELLEKWKDFNNNGAVEVNKKNFAKAEQHLLEAEGELNRIVKETEYKTDDFDYQYEVTYSNIGYLYYEQGEYAKAESYIKKQIILLENLRQKHPEKRSGYSIELYPLDIARYVIVLNKLNKNNEAQKWKAKLNILMKGEYKDNKFIINKYKSEYELKLN